ncbi:hypothetical protein DFP72DRAFT_591914 [Ephemerocybe angulata]|uniref:RRM domain-containing protein n=1 Tax=Ephemerocybe angulata TaxID=980116 RepID=A0A8H6IDR3_9AGAR|nr:hypothetical protein DFP72DRAFT_591914 [Tulosesus angulatus]
MSILRHQKLRKPPSHAQNSLLSAGNSSLRMVATSMVAPSPPDRTSRRPITPSHKKSTRRPPRRSCENRKQPPAPTLFVGNLPFETTEEDIRNLFESHRPVVKEGKNEKERKSLFKDESDEERKRRRRRATVKVTVKATRTRTVMMRRRRRRRRRRRKRRSRRKGEGEERERPKTSPKERRLHPQNPHGNVRGLRRLQGLHLYRLLLHRQRYRRPHQHQKTIISTVASSKSNTQASTPSVVVRPSTSYPQRRSPREVVADRANSMEGETEKAEMGGLSMPGLLEDLNLRTGVVTVLITETLWRLMRRQSCSVRLQDPSALRDRIGGSGRNSIRRGAPGQHLVRRWRWRRGRQPASCLVKARRLFSSQVGCSVQA